MKEELILSRTDRTAVDKIFRLRCKIESRMDYFIQAVGNYKDATRNDYDNLTTFTNNCTSLIKVLDKYKLITNTLTAEDQIEYYKIYQQVKNWKDRKTHLMDLFGIGQTDYKGLVLDKNVHHFVTEMAEQQKRAS